MIARTLKDEIDALEQAIHEFATAKNCAVSDIWVDEKNALSRIRNKAVIGLATAQLMENMTSEWRADDKKSAKPLVIGAAINQMFVDRDDATVALDNCPQGLLLTEYENLIQEAREQAKQLRHQTLIQLSQTDGLKKQYALELLDLDILIQAENEKLNQGRPIDFKGLRENQNLFSRRLDQLKTLGVTLKSDQDILNELCAVRLPIYTKMELVASLLFRL